LSKNKNIKMKTKNFRFGFLIFSALTLGLASCKKEGCMDPNASNYSEDAKKDDGSCVYPEETNTVVSGVISTNTTWTADKIYLLDGKVYVKSGVTLTIEPGTIIKGKQGQESLASALVVARGGKLMAVGTADKPIIFTSEFDNIKVGEKAGTNLLATDNEKWGGVAILGKAPISAQNGDVETNLEGIPLDPANPNNNLGLYGGTDAADNSGVIKYISIRHGGISIGEGNELNGLTLGGVGNGTVVENVEVYATLDDGIEIFGGTVNLTNCLVYAQGDDGIDLDQNWSGTMENFMVVMIDGVGTDKGLEIDGPEGTTYTDGLFTLRNGIVRKLGNDGVATDFKDKAQGTVENVTFEFGASKNKIRANFDANASCASKTDSYTKLMEDKLRFVNCKWNTTTWEVYTGVTACATEVPAAQTNAMTKYSEGTGSTLSTSIFSWTYAASRGQL
jgi:hypothetical protein